MSYFFTSPSVATSPLHACVESSLWELCHCVTALYLIQPCLALCPFCRCNGRIWTQNRSPFLWFSSSCKRIGGETGMLCSWKVSLPCVCVSACDITFGLICAWISATQDDLGINKRKNTRSQIHQSIREQRPQHDKTTEWKSKFFLRASETKAITVWFAGNNNSQSISFNCFSSVLNQMWITGSDSCQHGNFPLSVSLQPRPRNKLEENQRHPFPQQSENEEFKRRPWNPQLPAGGRRDVRMYGGESPRQKCSARSYFIPWWVNRFKLGTQVGANMCYLHRKHVTILFYWQEAYLSTTFGPQCYHKTNAQALNLPLKNMERLFLERLLTSLHSSLCW